MTAENPNPLGDVRVVDAHHHLWDLSCGRYPWLQREYDAGKFFLGDYKPLCRDFLPADYLRASSGCEVVATVHVEAERDRDEQLAETAWLHEQNAQHGIPNAIVAHAWLDRPETGERLLEHLRFPLVRGIRCKPLTSASPTESVHGRPGTMRDERWLRGLSLLSRLGLSWDLRVPYWHLAEAAEVAALFPKLRIALNHHGLAWDRSAEGLKRWRDAMAMLAAQPNVHVKLSEFGLKDQAWDYESNRRVVLDALAIFGVERAMFATNFPVAGLRIGYGDLVGAMSRMLSDMSPDQRDGFFWRNAKAFYRL
jgi:predicted TIM-barrel fold metal-dependent hydrolase